MAPLLGPWICSAEVQGNVVMRVEITVTYGTVCIYNVAMDREDAVGFANSVEPDQTASAV